MADTPRKCPSCGADCKTGIGYLDQSGSPAKTITHTCLLGCGYKRWDPLVPGAGVTIEELPPGSKDDEGEKIEVP